MKLFKYYKENPKGDEDDIIVILAENFIQVKSIIENKIRDDYEYNVQDNLGDFIRNFYPDFYNGKMLDESKWEVTDLSRKQIVWMSGEFSIK